MDGAVGPTAAGALTWVLAAGLLLGVLGAAAVRVVPAHERAVVLRLGRVVRLRGPGLVLLLPGLERATRVSLRDARVDAVGTRARTRDGVAVRVSASARYRVTDPARCCAAGPSPAARTLEAVEEALQHEVARSQLADLVGGSEERAERLVRATSGAAARWGVAVEDVAVVDVDLPLGPELLHWAAAQGAATAPRGR